MLDVISVSIIIMYRLEWAERARTSHALLCEHIQYFIFWNDSETSVRPISFNAFHFLFIILKSRQLRAPGAEI